MSGSAEANFASTLHFRCVCNWSSEYARAAIRLSGWGSRPGRKRGIQTIGEEKYLFLKGPKIIEPVSLPAWFLLGPGSAAQPCFTNPAVRSRAFLGFKSGSFKTLFQQPDDKGLFFWGSGFWHHLP
jgi:hypothetical protein